MCRIMARMALYVLNALPDPASFLIEQRKPALGLEHVESALEGHGFSLSFYREKLVGMLFKIMG